SRIGEALRDSTERTSKEKSARVAEVLDEVGLSAAFATRFPHQLSGGQRQRVAIAIALLNNPDLIIADEPTKDLDVTLQSQILYEVQTLARVPGTAVIWLTHDLTALAEIY
ncbi:ATP-binding cassette domain-containing protein, partial [Bacilli bacterium]